MRPTPNMAFTEGMCLWNLSNPLPSASQSDMTWACQIHSVYMVYYLLPGYSSWKSDAGHGFTRRYDTSIIFFIAQITLDNASFFTFWIHGFVLTNSMSPTLIPTCLITGRKTYMHRRTRRCAFFQCMGMAHVGNKRLDENALLHPM